MLCYKLQNLEKYLNNAVVTTLNTERKLWQYCYCYAYRDNAFSALVCSSVCVCLYVICMVTRQQISLGPSDMAQRFTFALAFVRVCVLVVKKSKNFQHIKLSDRDGTTLTLGHVCQNTYVKCWK